MRGLDLNLVMHNHSSSCPSAGGPLQSLYARFDKIPDLKSNTDTYTGYGHIRWSLSVVFRGTDRKFGIGRLQRDTLIQKIFIEKPY